MITDAIEQAISSAVRNEIERAMKTATENAKAELDRRIPEITAGLTIGIMKRVSMECLKDELLIHVCIENKDSSNSSNKQANNKLDWFLCRVMGLCICIFPRWRAKRLAGRI